MDAVIPGGLFQVQLNQAQLPLEALSDLAGVRIQQRLSQPSLCELYFHDTAEVGGALAGILPGSPFQVGPVGSVEPLFSGELTAIEYIYAEDGARSVYLRGYDSLHRLRRSAETRHFPNRSLQQVITTTAGQHGIPVSFDRLLKEINFSWPCLVQYNQSDLDFLVEQAYSLGVYLQMRAGTLAAFTLEGLAGDPIPLTYGVNLHQADLEINLEHGANHVFVTGWDHRLVRDLHQRASKRLEAVRRTDRPGGEPLYQLPDVHLAYQIVVDESHARALAQAEMDRRAAGLRVLRGVADGGSDFYPGRRVVVREVAPALTGVYVLTGVTHIYDSSGYTVRFDTTPPQLRLRPQSTLFSVGAVLDNRDPDNQGRAQVVLPSLAETALWLPVALPGAGDQKGMYYRPEPGDKVAVLLMNDNPGLGIVLGGLYSGKRQPAEWSDLIDPNASTYSLVTPGQQQLQLRDSLAGGAIRLMVAGGAYIELNGSHITIAGSAIDFEKL